MCEYCEKVFGAKGSPYTKAFWFIIWQMFTCMGCKNDIKKNCECAKCINDAAEKYDSENSGE